MYSQSRKLVVMPDLQPVPSIGLCNLQCLLYVYKIIINYMYKINANINII